MQRKLSTSMIINEDGTYLENYLSTVGELPNDVKRTLAVIREIDLLTSYKMTKVTALTQEAISAPALSKTRSELIKAIRSELAEAEALAEEKKSLVTQSIDLVDGHKKTLELVLDKFGIELFGESSKDTFSIFKSKPKRKKSSTTDYVPKKKKCEVNEKVDTITESIIKETENEKENKKKGATKKKEDKKEKVAEEKKEKKEIIEEKKEKKEKAEEKKEKKEKVEEKIPEKVDDVQASETKTTSNDVQPVASETAITTTAAAGGDDVVEDEDMNLYCFCQRLSFGEMIECENPKCKYQWFHFECLGITTAPRGKWYCPECRKLRKKKR